MSKDAAFEIRIAQPADAAVVTDFNIGCAAESENLTLDPPRVRAGVEAVLADAKRGRYYLAEDAGGAIGQIMITLEWSDWRNAWIWWIQSVYVHRDARRRGVFSALLQHIEKEAQRERAALLRLYVDTENDAAERTYLANGFKRAHYRMLDKLPPSS
ncbi:MAG: GNAT family N-acetyltransferase [Gammaproteobacteria bacterium]